VAKRLIDESEWTPRVLAIYGKAGEIEVPVTRISEMLRMVNLNNIELVFSEGDVDDMPFEA
jgi:hypothetical protein